MVLLFAATGSPFAYDFMRNAFLAGSAIAVVSGLIGYFIILRHQSFAGDALSHVAFAGALGAAVIGWSPIAGLFGGTILVAIGMSFTANRRRLSDVNTGTILAWVLGIGALFLSIYTSTGGGANGTLGIAVLFGSLLSISTQQVHILIIAGILTIGVMILILRPLLFASLDSEVAMAKGMPIQLLSFVFMILAALTVSEAVQAIGALLIFALLITPASTAQLLTTQPYRAIAYAVIIALIQVWLGLFIAFYTPLPTSFVISAVAFVFYVAALIYHTQSTQSYLAVHSEHGTHE